MNQRKRVSRPCFSVRGSCKMLMWINLLSYIVFLFLHHPITLTHVVSSLVRTGFARIVVVCVDAFKIKRLLWLLMLYAYSFAILCGWHVRETSKSNLSLILTFSLFLKMLLLSPIIASLPPLSHRRSIKPSGRVVAKAKDNTETGGFLEKVAIGGGLVSTPVIGWSLYTLKTTGCGLPPGPAGSIGALEGVSYLVVVGIVGWSLYTKTKTGSGLPNGPFGLLGAVEGLSYLSVLAILVVFGLQFLDNGSVPGPLPSDQCFG